MTRSLSALLLPALLLLGLAVHPAVRAGAAQPVLVTQSGRAFSVQQTRIARGDSIRLRNADEFLHQAYVQSATFNYESAEQEPGQSVDIRFPVSGTFAVRCQIHPKMLLTVTVD